MAGTFVDITAQDFAEIVEPLGFRRVNLDGTHEIVYGRRADCNGRKFTVRIYTGIDAKTGHSRKVGSDAIRVCMVGMDSEGKIYGAQKDRRVNRTKNWARNIGERLSHFDCGSLRYCPDCMAPMAYSSRKERFYCSEICWNK